MNRSNLSFSDVLNNNVATLVVMRADDLKQTIIETVNEARKKMEEDIALNNVETLLTTNQVLERLAISRTTLWNRNKSGYIQPVEIGGKLRYKLSDVNAILKGVKKT